MSSAYLEIKGLKKSFHLKPVLRGISLTLEAGERVALLGANGAGKTTLLRILAALIRPDAGQVTIAGLDLAEQAQEIRRRVGFVAHQPYLYEELTARENLLFFARLYGVQQAQARALALLQRVELDKKARERAGSLSRGQLQRLALARALLHEPEILLLDEPDTGLDQKGIELLTSLLQEHHQRGGSTLFTTHDLQGAAQRSDRVVMLHNGRIAYQQETASLEKTAGILQTYQEVVK